ncbi:AraC family transcriptional regulator [Emticicia sp. BO119]|uniref:AraC family transcriptional regulator n=1 Tax=Emticicia sp. BO119 TaxID=2757768 RepID=UPI0015F03610|nr:AraC family transcriptional regulator [Emticicia sp. BO119]MBA4852853.1 helix-turn-helix domain-containing protein [Emticicia sp. BO119]
MKILALHLHHVIEYASMRGISRQELISLLAKPPANFLDETETISKEDFYAVIDTIANQLKEEELGIRLGNFLNLGALGLIYQISLQATTTEEALYYLQMYLNATLPFVNIQTSIDADWVSIILNIDNKQLEANRIILENILTVIAREVALMTTKEVSIIKTSPFFTKNYPDDWKASTHYSVNFTPTILKATLQDKSRLHLDVLIPEYLKLIEGLKTETGFANKVRIASLHLAKPELPDLASVADAFHLTSRTFQRRLLAENTTFRQITDDLRKQISNLLIRHNRFSITDISYVLGYSEPAAFIHSFKKWFGEAPDRMRQKAFS